MFVQEELASSRPEAGTCDSTARAVSIEQKAHVRHFLQAFTFLD